MKIRGLPLKGRVIPSFRTLSFPPHAVNRLTRNTWSRNISNQFCERLGCRTFACMIFRTCRRKPRQKWKQHRERPLYLVPLISRSRNQSETPAPVFVSRERRCFHDAQIRSDHRSSGEHVDDSHSIRLRSRNETA